MILAPAAATAVTANGGMLSSLDGRTTRRTCSIGSGSAGGVRFRGAAAGGEAAEHSNVSTESTPRLLGLHSKSPPLLPLSDTGVGTSISAARLDPLPSAVTGRPCPGCDTRNHFDTLRGSGDQSPSRDPSIRPKLVLGQTSNSTVGCLPKAGEGNSYWDILGAKVADGTCHGDVRAAVENSEMAENSVASVVLLRWAMEYVLEHEGDGNIDGGCRDRLLTDDGEDPHVPVAGSRDPCIQGEAMNATIPGPVHLMHSARKPRDSDLFLLSGPLESGNKRSEDSNMSPRERARIGFAATSPTSSAFSRTCNFGRHQDHKSATEDGDGREGDCNRVVSDIGENSSAPGEEPKSTARDLERYTRQGARYRPDVDSLRSIPLSRDSSMGGRLFTTFLTLLVCDRIPHCHLIVEPFRVQSAYIWILRSATTVKFSFKYLANTAVSTCGNNCFQVSSTDGAKCRFACPGVLAESCGDRHS